MTGVFPPVGEPNRPGQVPDGPEIEGLPLGQPQDPGHRAGGPEINDEASFEQMEVAGLSQGQIVRKRFFRHKGAVISLTVFTFILILAVTSIGIGPWTGWWKWTIYDRPDIVNGASPTLSLWGTNGFRIGDHPFGQDETGRDMFAATMRGVQNTLVVIIILGLLSTTLGILVGAASGYFGGWIDAVLMRFTDMIIIIPIILIAAVAGFAFKATGIVPLSLVLGFLSWVGLARLVRGEFLGLREREFVDAARVAGASPVRIIFKHILPNSVGVIVVNTTILMGGGILLEAALGFLGFGIQPPNISLGSLITQYQSAFSVRPWLFVWPGIFIISLVLCIQFIGDGLRDAFDPRQKRIPKKKDLDKSVEKVKA